MQYIQSRKVLDAIEEANNQNCSSIELYHGKCCQDLADEFTSAEWAELRAYIGRNFCLTSIGEPCVGLCNPAADCHVPDPGHVAVVERVWRQDLKRAQRRLLALTGAAVVVAAVVSAFAGSPDTSMAAASFPIHK
jgi:hypothetical protein